MKMDFHISTPFVLQNYLTLLDDEDHTLESLKIHDEQQLVIEGMKLLVLLFHFSSE